MVDVVVACSTINEGGNLGKMCIQPGADVLLGVLIAGANWRRAKGNAERRRSATDKKR